MGLERTFYSESEDVGLVEVCVVVYMPLQDLDCPINFPFDIQLSTADNTACKQAFNIIIHFCL